MMAKNGTALKGEWESFIREGNESAYYPIYAHYHKYFTFIGTKRGASSEKIADCIHDLFLYVFENREKLSHIQDHHNYLVSSFLRALLKKARFSIEESEDLEILRDVPLMHSTEQNFMVQDTNEQVRQILKTYIDGLSMSQSRIIYEKFYLNLSYEEIAASHNITVRTAYNTIFKAVNQLRKQIGEHKLASLAASLTTLSLLFYFFSR